MDQFFSLKAVINSVLFSFIGLAVLWVAFYLFDKGTPGSFWKEIVEEHNIALAITAGAVILAFGQIISSAING